MAEFVIKIGKFLTQHIFNCTFCLPPNYYLPFDNYAMFLLPTLTISINLFSFIFVLLMRIRPGLRKMYNAFIRIQ